MRDDLHKGMPLPRPWKKAVGACLRAADEGLRSRGLVADALENDLRQSVTVRGLELIARECDAPTLPLDQSSENKDGSLSGSELSVTELRLRAIARGRIDRGENSRGADAVKASLHDLAAERMKARRNQAEGHFLEEHPRDARKAIVLLRKNFQADLPRVVDRLFERNSEKMVSESKRKLDPDEDLR